MACVRMSAVAALTVAAFLSIRCATFRGGHTAARTVIATYSLWDGMGAPKGDPQFPEFECRGTLTISTVDVTFRAGASPGCAQHQRTVGTLPYCELREIRVTTRPELLIFSKNAEPPALR